MTTIEEKKLSKAILIVDDDPDMTSIFSLGLQDEGFEVDSHNDPLEALSKFRPNFYDLLLVGYEIIISTTVYNLKTICHHQQQQRR